MNDSCPTDAELRGKRCVPCEGGVPKLTPAQAERLRGSVPGWKIVHDGERLRREWTVRKFTDAVAFFNAVAGVAEAEGHHPDLHLVGYRNAAVEIWTHAIGGLSENDFILAAKIDALPIAVKGTAGAVSAG